MKPSHPHSRSHRPGARRAGGAPERVHAGASDRWVRVTCPECGVVRVRIDDVVLRSCVDDRSWSYRARCSRCRTLFVAATPAPLAQSAITAGVSVEHWTLPEPSPRHGDGPLREADAIELHLALLGPGWFEELTRERPPEAG